jgi:DNA-binding NarL/FixJ family response regulator
MTGHENEVTTLREAAIERYLADGEVLSAGRCAFWLGFHLENSGQHARAAGWRKRFERLVAADPAAFEPLSQVMTLARAGPLLLTGRFAEAAPLFELSQADSLRHGDADAAVLSGSGLARCYEALGRPHDAIALFDEIMIDVLSKPIAPQLVGLVYCSMIDLCVRYLDFARAQEWTTALSQWCDGQVGLVLYRDACVAHQAELLQLKGSWREAEDVAQRATARAPSTAGLAHYRLAELMRLRGRVEEAEQEYRAAASCGCDVQPGLARLRAAQGRLAVAQAGLSRASDDDPTARRAPQIEAAQIEISMLRGDMATAQDALEILSGLAAAPGSSAYLQALAAHATGSVLLVQDRPREALVELRRAAAGWAGLEAPYEMARTRAMIAQALQVLGDEDAAAIERDTARTTFETLGATVDLAAISSGAQNGSGLSPRELEVLRLLATGATNRAISDRLVISEKTVARHVSNVFGKLGVSNRAAATAYAYEHDLA